MYRLYRERRDKLQTSHLKPIATEYDNRLGFLTILILVADAKGIYLLYIIAAAMLYLFGSFTFV